MKKILKKEFEVQPIMLPNFILVGEDKSPVYISEFTEEELRELCLEFTENLIKKSKNKSTLTV